MFTMFTHKATLAAVLAVSSMFLGGDALAADSTNTWQIVAPQGSGFSILMPGNPTLKTLSTTFNGAELVSRYYQLGSTDGSEEFLVGYADYPAGTSASSILEANRKSEVGSARLLWEQYTTINGHRGKRIAVTDGTRAWVSEFYVVGNRGYAARYLTRNLLRAVLDAMPFLGSFQIVQSL